MLDKLTYDRSKLYLFFATFGLRLGVVCGPVLLTYVISNIYSVSVVGDFTVAVSIVLGVSLLSRFGMDQAIIRYAAINESITERTGILLKCLVAVAITSCFLILLSYPILEKLVYYEWLRVEPYNLVTVMLWSVIPINGLYLISGFYKGFDNPAISVFFEYGVGCLGVSVIIFLFSLLFPTQEYQDISYVFLGCFCFIFVFSLMLPLRSFSDIKVAKRSEFKVDKPFILFSASLAILGLSYFVQNVLVYVIGGAFLSSGELGGLRIVAQVSALISFPLVVINVFAPGRYAKLHKQKNYEGLKSFFRLTSIGGLCLSIPGVLLIYFGGERILETFGLGKDVFLEALYILTVSQVINVATGSVGFLLSMTGKVIVARNIVSSVMIIGLIVFFILIREFNFTGAVWGMFFLLVVPNIISFFYGKRSLQYSSSN